ncbi:MAG: Uma2 family endonuclease [Acidobacteria bacterium]|nr:Uma2 family endonuclease [Acidobacteriota bacterium]
MAVRDTAHRKLTYEDYAAIPDDGQRHEIIDGGHYVTPAPSLHHQRRSSDLHLILAPFVREHQLGEVLYAPADVCLSPHDIVQPDLFFVSTARLAILTDANVAGAPDLVIEILSDSTRRRDQTLKRDRYEQLGVNEYWLIDPRHQAVRIFRRNQHGRFDAPIDLTAVGGDILTTPLLPGLEILLRDLFR